MDRDKFKFPNQILPYLLVLPQVVVVLIFIVFPTFESFRMSTYMSDAFGHGRVFVGLENYIDLLTSTEYQQTIIVTLIFTLAVTFIGLALGLMISLLLNRKIKGLSFYRTALIWPYALSPAVVGAIWMFLFHPSYGVLTYISPLYLNWLERGSHALILLIIAAIWRNLGYNIAFYLAGLQNIPQNLLEAASIDGAGAIGRFRKIIFPLISPTTFFLFTMNLIYAFYQIFGLVHTVTKGGPGGATNVMVYSAYRDGVTHLMPGFSAAQSVIMFVIAVGLVYLQFKYAQRGVYYA
ncbi:carbohydrate ABC transporter permease [Halarsenatibacter silvermanii]|uniref:Carbohydrate ABC transporter membrane protein 1, CUT1 family n=1 Tax=Halarsenatibacter silvermanii TaxID=321763 RepID=A0A1G9HA21_9FIRM|nr:sugar ABC transporter permease [Halarsenatibacter silvermanii]SDL09838.1 carbohydrate ABC transporter membrane protein 1, CUT1 family [Halarsenatibacter silvermanii]